MTPATVGSARGADRFLDRLWFLPCAYGVVGVALACCYLQIWPEVTRDSSMRLTWCKQDLALLAVLATGAPMVIALRTPRATKSAVHALLAKQKLPAIMLGCLIPASLSAALGIGYWVLDGFPNSGDEFAYVFQSELFRQGQLWAPAPPLGDALVAFRTWVLDDRWASQYPPGWPALIALMASVGIPAAAVNGCVAGAVAATTALLTARLTHSRLAATAAVLVLTLNPFFLFQGGSFHSHMVAALQLTLLVWLLATLRDSFSARAAVLAGGVLALAVATRYFVLVAMLPMLAMWAVTVPGRTALRVAPLAAAGAAPVILALLAYQHALTGDALRTTYALISVPESTPGLSLVVLTKGLEFTVYRVLEAVTWLSPAHVVVFMLALVLKLRTRQLGFEDLLLPGFILAYVCFPDVGGNRYGPRYYFDAYPVGVAATIAGLFQVSPALAPDARAHWAPHVLVHLTGAACLTGVLAAVTAIPFHRAQVQQRQEPYRMVTEAGISNAIVIVDRRIKDGLIAQDYARNPPSLDASVLYARQGTPGARIREAFPERSIWVYERGADARRGRLRQLSMGEPANQH